MHLIYISIGFCVMEYGVALDSPKSARILKYDFENTGTGPYHYSFDTSDGISRKEVGEVELAGTEDQFVKIVGSFSYPGPDGVIYEVRYTADDQGFHPEGDHIMVPPFVPWIHHHHDKHHHEEIDAPKKTDGNHFEPSGTSPEPFIKYSGISKPPTSEKFIEDDHPRTPQPPLKFDLLLSAAPDDADRMQPSYPKPMAPQANHGNFPGHILSTTSETPEPSQFLHSTPKVAVESPSFPNPSVPRAFDGNYIASSTSSAPSPDASPILYSTPPAAIQYSSPNPRRPPVPQIHGTTPQPLQLGSIPSSTPSAQIPMGYFLPRPIMDVPLREVEESRAYIPPVSTTKPLVR